MSKNPTKEPTCVGLSAKIPDKVGAQVAAQSRCDDSSIEEARKRLRTAENWVLDNPDAWRQIELLAASDYRSGVPVSLKVYFERLRHRDWIARDGRPTPFCNGLTAALGRILASRHPEYRHLMRLRRSCLDVLDGGDHRAD